MSDRGVQQRAYSTAGVSQLKLDAAETVTHDIANDLTEVTPKRAGALPPLGWLGVVLLVAGAILITMGVLNQGGASVEPVVGGGSLVHVKEAVGAEVVGPNALIGEAHVSETVAVFDAPQGSPIARADGGVYGLLDSRPGWARLVFFGPDAEGLYQTGWVQVSDTVSVRVG